MRKHLLTAVLAAFTIAAIGCSSGGGELKAADKDTLKSNLNSPVNVEKVRADYAKQNGTETGRASGDQ